MAKLYAGVDLGGTSMIAVISDRHGKVHGASDCATTPGAAPAATIDTIAEQVRQACHEAGVSPSKLHGLGIGAPGAIDPPRGVVVRAPNLGWTDVPLAAELTKRLDLPVTLGNDVQVGILGEQTFGVARGLKNVVGVWVGTGIGGGVIINGQLYRGSRGAAGEIGHMVLDEQGPLCGCGRHGCVEAFASRTAMERDVRAASKKRKSVVLRIMKERDKTRMTSSVIQRALNENDAVMKDVLAAAAHRVGLLVGNIVNMLDPEMVVIGGGIAARLPDEFVSPIRETARTRFLRPDPDGVIRIEAATLGDYSGALGAVALARG